MAAGFERTLAQARSLLGAARAADALAALATLAGDALERADAQLLAGICHVELGRLDQAVHCVERALQFDSADVSLLLDSAMILRRAGSDARAIALLRHAARLHPDSIDARARLGAACLAAGQPAEAIAPLRQALVLDAARAGEWHALGVALRRCDRLEEAREALATAVEHAPQDAVAWANLGGVCRLLGRVDEAWSAYRCANERGLDTPELADAMNGVLLDLGRVEQAHAGAAALVRRHPPHPGAQDTLARLLWEHPDLAPEGGPFVHFQAAVHAHPENAALQARWLRLLLEARRPRDALVQAEVLHRRDPSDPVWLWMCADAHHQLEQFEEAGRLYAHLDRLLAGHSPEFLNAHARHLFRAGEWEHAGRQAQRAIALSPCDQEAWSHLGTWWRLDGDAREAWLFGYDTLVADIEVQMPDGRDVAGFCHVLGEALDTLHAARREPVNQSVRGGSQTTGRLFGRADAVVECAHAALLSAAQRWVAGLPDDPRHPFLSRRSDVLRAVGSWSVKLRNSGRHSNHIHPEGWMSSAFYVRLPASMKNAAVSPAGALQLGQPLDELGLDLPPRRILHPREGHLVLFPSYLWHGTVPFQDETPRLTVAFDMQPG